MMRLVWVHVIALLLAWVAPARAAASTDEATVAISPLEVRGPLESHWRKLLGDRVREGLARSELGVATTPKVCATAPCRARLAADLGVDFLVEPVVTVQDQSYEIELRLVSGEDGGLVTTARESCELCGVSEVGDIMAAQSAALVAKMKKARSLPASVRIETQPEGAQLRLDGREVGATTLTLECTPGPHRIQLDRVGYESRSVDVECVAGRMERISLELRPDRRARRRQWMLPWGATLTAIGVAAVATGVTLLLIDGNEYGGRCTGDDRDEFGNCRYRLDTLAGGLAATIGGGVVLGTGVGLLIGTRKRGGKLRPAVALAPVPGRGRN